MVTARSPQRRADDGRRAELVNAARTVIARDGVPAATTRRIAQEAGLPHGTFHYWFSGKEELFEELIAEVLAELADAATTAAAASGPGASVLDMLRAAFDVVENDEKAQPGRQLAMYELTTFALRTPALRDLARRQYQAYRDIAAAIATSWMETRQADLPGGSDALMRLMAVLFDGVVLAWLADPDGTNPDELFRLIDALVETSAGRPTDGDEPGASTSASASASE
jgi:AcrR family transcriptional regulator